MNENQVVAVVESMKADVAQYLEIMELFPCVDVSTSREFQRCFNAFYRIRQHTQEWYSEYYQMMQAAKTMPVSFAELLDAFYERTGRCEASFLSKLAATVNPELPIWDTYILRALGLKAPTPGTRSRFQCVKSTYEAIIRWYDQKLPTPEARWLVAIFDAHIRLHDRLTPIKKLDFILWKSRGMIQL